MKQTLNINEKNPLYKVRIPLRMTKTLLYIYNLFNNIQRKN